MPNYNRKLLNPLSDTDFVKGMNTGRFVRSVHRGFVAFLFYTGSRVSEALKMKRKQFKREGHTLFIDIGERLKHSKRTDPLPIPLESAFVDSIVDSYVDVKMDRRVWPYCRSTGYNIVKRVFPLAYPHYFRFSRITWFFENDYTIAQVRSWSGLTLRALNFYVLRVAIKDMGKSMIVKK